MTESKLMVQSSELRYTQNTQLEQRKSMVVDIIDGS